MLFIRKIMIKLGFKIHAGWVPTHRSGYNIKCIKCGERRVKVVELVSPKSYEWWETEKSGDGSCGNIKELSSTGKYS